jgi:diguanylate cyclase (GGDEF)-like protein
MPANVASRMCRLGLLVLGFCFSSLALSAAEFYDFDRFSDQLGGRQSTVYEIFEDHQGFLWFAGDTDGLLRFDGYELMSWSADFLASEIRHNVSTQVITRDGRLWVGSWGNGLQFWDAEQQQFVQFLPDRDDPDSLADNRVQTFLEDSEGRLWIGTVDGINFIDPDQPNQLRRYAVDQPEHPLHRERIWRMVEVDEAIWLATSSGVYRISRNGPGWQRYRLTAGPLAAEHERSEEVRTVAYAHGRLWAASQLGAFYWDADADEFLRVEFPQASGRAQPRFNELLESRDHGILAGAHDGLYRIDPVQVQFRRFGEREQLIPDVDVRALHEDDQGNLWIGTRDQGLIFGRRQQPTFVPVSRLMPAELVETGGRLNSALLTDSADRLWLSFPGGVLRLDQDGAWQSWRFPALDAVRRVERILEDDQGQVWLATDGGLFLIDGEDRLQARTDVFEQLGLAVLPVSEMWQAPGGCLWLALWHHGLVCWDPDGGPVEVYLTELQQTRGDSVYHLADDAEGRLWVATRYSGLFSIELAQREARHWPLQQHERHEPSYYCVVPDQARLWVCTEDGLVQFDPQTGRQQRYGTEHGLPAARVFGAFNDAAGSLWVLTPNGLARLLPDRQRFVSYGLADGLPGLGLQRNAVTLDALGRLVVGTSRGAALLQQQRLPPEYESPRLVLSRAWIGREDITRQLHPTQPEIRLAASQRDLLLQFAVLDFHEPTRNIMRLKLHGLDDDFGPLSTDRSIRYVNLAPGRYELEVEGWNSRGVRSEQDLRLPIIVAAPWWQSVWVGLLVLAALVALAWFLIRIRFRSMRSANVRLQAMVNERTRALADANDQLRAQSTQDFLTGLLNRRGFTDQFNTMRLKRASDQQAISLVLFDLDHFKALNDLHGHDAGDRVLRQVAEILVERLPKSSLAARWGGEEFLIALDGYTVERAVAICHDLRRAFAASPLRFDDQEVPYSATFGIVSALDSETSLEGWIRLVDQALYEGKRAGRDRIRVYGQAEGLAD